MAMKQELRVPLRCAATARIEAAASRPAQASTPPPLPTRFVSEGVLGIGGLGQVEQAFDQQLQRDVAIKTLYAGSAGRKRPSDELRREAHIAAGLEHPNIPPVYELLGAAEGGVGLVMMLVEGDTLSERFRQLGPAIDNQTVLRPLLEVLIQVCDAIAYAHAQRVLHLDIKPDNVMIEPGGRVFVLDWGGAVRSSVDAQGHLHPVETHRRTYGTLLYMAPEQFEYRLPRVDQRTDVYALGGLVYQAITGRAPFHDAEVARRAKSRPLCPPPIELKVRTPLLTRLEQLALRALAPDKEQRYPDVSSFKRELQAIAREESFLLPLHFKADDYIVREGDVADAAYIVIEGECRVCVRGSDGDVPVAVIGAGETFGESAMLVDGRRSASIVAATDVTLLAFSREEIGATLGTGWLSIFMRNLVQRSMHNARA